MSVLMYKNVPRVVDCCLWQVDLYLNCTEHNQKERDEYLFLLRQVQRTPESKLSNYPDLVLGFGHIQPFFYVKVSGSWFVVWGLAHCDTSSPAVRYQQLP